MRTDSAASLSDGRTITAVAAAFCAVAIGGFVVGALTARRMAIRQIAVERAAFKSLPIGDLTVRRLHAADVTIDNSLALPGGDHVEPSPGERPASVRAEGPT